MTNKYIIKVADHQPVLLPRPRKKLFLETRSETLKELEIIPVRCELNEV